MNQVRIATPGKTRSCPHCKATILESAAICPGCQHHLRFGDAAAGQRSGVSISPLRVEGTIRHPPNGDAWEYSVVLAIRNGRGEEISRQIVGVGALLPSEQRTFAVSVEVFAPRDTKTIEGVPTTELPNPAALPQAAAPQAAASPARPAAAPQAPGAPARPAVAPQTAVTPPRSGLGLGSKPPLAPPSRAPLQPSKPPPPVKPLSQQNPAVQSGKPGTQVPPSLKAPTTTAPAPKPDDPTTRRTT